MNRLYILLKVFHNVYIYKFYMNQLYINQITFCFTMSYKTARFKLLYVVVMLGDIHLQDAAEVWMVAGYWSHS